MPHAWGALEVGASVGTSGRVGSLSPNKNGVCVGVGGDAHVTPGRDGVCGW